MYNLYCLCIVAARRFFQTKTEDSLKRKGKYAEKVTRQRKKNRIKGVSASMQVYYVCTYVMFFCYVTVCVWMSVMATRIILYVTLHKKTIHNMLDINLRYSHNSLFHILAYELWLEEISCVAT